MDYASFFPLSYREGEGEGEGGKIDTETASERDRHTVSPIKLKDKPPVWLLQSGFSLKAYDMPIMPKLERLRQDHEFGANMEHSTVSIY